MSQVIRCDLLLYIVGLYSCGKLDTVRAVNVLTGLLIWGDMLCFAVEWPGVLRESEQLTIK